ncbi:MAG: efflux RND transporter permease subunit [Sedimentisphaerales bacterium]|nr:efflux RND transporter permease subunit [Sedimentisphaerales bacterium]
MNLTKLALSRPIGAAVIAIAVFVVGLFSLKQLDVDYLPEITYPMIKIHIWWRGATPEDIDKNIADPIERVLATVDNLDYLESSSIEGMYALQVNFEYGVDVEEAYQDVITAMGRIARELPADMDPPVIIKADPSQLPVMQVTVSSERRDLVWLRDWCDNWLQDRIVTVPGTAGVEIVGGLKREIRVHLDPSRMLAYGLSPSGIAKTLYEENKEMFAGRVTVESREIIARTMGEFESLEEIRNVVVAHSDRGLVYLKDVAGVEDSHEEVRVITRFNGENCVKLSILKQAEANTVKVAQAVKEKLEQLKSEIPDDIVFGVVENQGDYVMAAINSVKDSAIIAAILVIIVTYIFLGHWRQIIVLMIAMPLTLVANFLVMKMAGFSINIFSLGGLVVAMGVVLDNSIVAVENITRIKNLNGSEATLKAMSEIGTALLAATLSYLALFLPFLLVPGLISLLFKELVMVIAGIVVLSLFIALTLTPLIADRLIKKGHIKAGIGHFIDKVNDYAAEGYGKLLTVALRLKWVVVLIAAALLGLGIYLFGVTGSEFFPEIDDGRVMVKVILPAGTSVEKTNGILETIEQKIKDDDVIQSCFTLVGGRVWGLYTYEIAEQGEADIQLVTKTQRKISTDDFIKKLRPEMAKIPVPGGKIAVMHMPIKGIRKTGQQQVEVKVNGSDLAEIFAFAQKAVSTLNQTEGLTGVNLSMDMTKPEYRVYVDRARASVLQIPIRQVAQTLRSLIQGEVATQYGEGSEYYAIRVMVPETKITSKEDIEQLILENTQGEQFYLRDIAEVKRAVGPVEIVREDQIKQVIVRADADRISVGQAVERAQNALSSLDIPQGVYLEMGGQAQMMAEMTKTAKWIMVFAVFFAFVVLAVQFESLKLPLLILICLPFCLIGMVFGLYFSGIAIGATVPIGLLVVVAATMNDGVLLLTYAEVLRRGEHISAFEAVYEASKIRFRPRTMTTLTTIAGFIPLALNLGEGGDLLQPMAIGAIGGLVFEIAVALILMPCVYAIVQR